MAINHDFSFWNHFRYHHNIHKNAEEKVIKALEARGVETKKVQRMNYTNELIDWADVIFTTGGDGTFLLGASKVRNPNVPVIGINTDPTRSEGYLCIPKHFSFSLDHAIEMLLNGHFRYLIFKFWQEKNRQNPSLLTFSLHIISVSRKNSTFFRSKNFFVKLNWYILKT